MVVDEIMQPEVFCVPESMSVRELWEELSAQEIAGAPVLDEKDYLVGVVSVTDIARSLAVAGVGTSKSPRSYYSVGALDALIPSPERIEKKLLVGDIMSRTIHKVSHRSSVVEALDLMILEDIHRLIVTHRGHVIGILTSGDLLRAFRTYLVEDEELGSEEEGEES